MDFSIGFYGQVSPAENFWRCFSGAVAGTAAYT